MNAWKPILAALVIFAAGVVTGGLTVTLRPPSRPAHPGAAPARKPAALPREAQLRELSRRMEKDLALKPDQRQRIEAIIHDSQDRMKSVWDQVGPKVREEFREMRQKIRAELTEDQRRKFEQIMKQHDERVRRDERDTRPAVERE